MKQLHAFFIALSLLTRIPVPASCFKCNSGNEPHERSVLHYPLVGFLLALLLCPLLFIGVTFFSALFTAALILSGWVALTGALHLDGLADATDGLFAGHKPKTDILNVLKDPHIGTMGVVSIVLLLVLKLSVLAQLVAIPLHAAIAIMCACVLARLVALLYMAYTPYARDSGIGSKLDAAVYKQPISVMSAVIFVALLIMTSTVFVLVTCSMLALLLFGWRRLWLSRIGGYTGDCLGALIEMAETLILICAACCF